MLAKTLTSCKRIYAAKRGAKGVTIRYQFHSYLRNMDKGYMPKTSSISLYLSLQFGALKYAKAHHGKDYATNV